MKVSLHCRWSACFLNRVLDLAGHHKCFFLHQGKKSVFIPFSCLLCSSRPFGAAERTWRFLLFNNVAIWPVLMFLPSPCKNIHVIIIVIIVNRLSGIGSRSGKSTLKSLLDRFISNPLWWCTEGEKKCHFPSTYVPNCNCRCGLLPIPEMTYWRGKTPWLMINRWNSMTAHVHILSCQLT